jgi:hypothetical protein
MDVFGSLRAASDVATGDIFGAVFSFMEYFGAFCYLALFFGWGPCRNKDLDL